MSRADHVAGVDVPDAGDGSGVLPPPPLADSPPRPVDRETATRAVAQLLTAFGYELDENLRDTPRRVVESFEELLRSKPFRITTFPNDEAYDEMIIATGIPFHSLCEHHLLPFVGVAHVAYIPGERILGLSKLGRVVELFARRLQRQERLTKQIAEWLEGTLAPKGVGVVLEAEHMCMSLRGVVKPGARTVTSAVLGAIRDDTRTRQEFLRLIGDAQAT